MEAVVESILSSMSSVKKPQRTFLLTFFSVLMVFQGKATYRNLSRYCGFHEKRFARWSRRFFNFAEFNRKLLQHELPSEGERIAAVDASFMKKSGRPQDWVGFTTVR